jgi:sialic acid synthase SpsE
MADLAGVADAVRQCEAHGARNMALLHCTSLYPAPAPTLNLAAMDQLAASFPYPIGYSDHHVGSLAVLAAVARGACIIEKHFTLDRTRPGADHHLSIEPAEMAEMVRSIRAIEAMIGRPEKKPTAEETRLAPERWRYLVARRAIGAGETLAEDMLAAKRTPSIAGAIRALGIDSVAGRKAARAIPANAVLTTEDIEPHR